MVTTEKVLIEPYYRIRYGRVELVRQHWRRPWRWANRVYDERRDGAAEPLTAPSAVPTHHWVWDALYRQWRFVRR